MSKGTNISSVSGSGGGVTIGQAVTGGTPSTLLWVDSGGLVQSGATIAATATIVLVLGDNATAPSIKFGGTTASFPSLTSVGTQLQALLADNSAATTMLASGFVASLAGTGFQLAVAGPRMIGDLTGMSVVNSGATVYLPVSGSRINILGSINVTNDTALERDSAGVAFISDGAGNARWIQNKGGEASLAANFTRSDTTLTATNLSRTVISGRTYNFECNLFISQATAASGWQLDFNGGSAAMTNFVCHAESIAETGIIVVLANATSAALATVINATTTVTTGGQVIKIVGSFVPSGAGTFILRACDNSGAGTLTIKRGSHLILRDTPAL